MVPMFFNILMMICGQDAHKGERKFRKNLFFCCEILLGISQRKNQIIKKQSESESRSVGSNSLWPHGLQLARLLCPWTSPGKNSRVGCHSILQGIFLTHRSNLVSRISGRFFTVWATWTFPFKCKCLLQKDNFYSISRTSSMSTVLFYFKITK